MTTQWDELRHDLGSQAEALCRKVEAAIEAASDLPPLELAEALEDAANEYLRLFEEISELHRTKPPAHNITSITAAMRRKPAPNRPV